MVIVEPLVSEEKLRQLLDEQTESAALDFKSECDLRQKADTVELVKDVGAMQVAGGYIVIGADNNGRPTNRVAMEPMTLFDEATLRAKMRKWLPEPLDLLSAAHTVDDSKMVLIYVGPNPDGFAVFQADGQYVVRGQEKTAFRKGDVFARHGSASEPWSQADIRLVLDRLVASRKEEWRRGLATDLARVGAGSEARRLADAPAQALTWNLDSSSFEDTIIEQLRTGDDIPLRLLLERLPGEAAMLVRDDERVADLPTLFDRLACIGGLGLRLERHEVVRALIVATGRVYDVGFALERDRTGAAIDAAGYWLALIERVIALGALAVRTQAWPVVRDLSLRRGESDDWRYDRSWLRHALTMAARAKLFVETENGRDVERSILSLAHRVAANEPCLRTDVPADDDALLDSICQFDALAALAMVSETRAISGSRFYPNFSRFYSHRTEPAFARLLSDPAMRAAIFPLADDDLASALRGLDEFAQRESFRFAGWDGFTDERILRWLDKHPAQPRSAE
jgi:hypothetical protein